MHACDGGRLFMHGQDPAQVMEGGEVSSSFLEHVQCITHALSVPHQAKDKVKACWGWRSMHAFCLELTVSPHGSPKHVCAGA